MLMTDEFIILAQGHHNVRSTHKTTWQLTREDHLSPRGECIVGVEASAACADLPGWLRDHLQAGGRIETVLSVGEEQLRGTAEGHTGLSLSDEKDMVFRRSSYVCDRTVAINSSLVSQDLPRSMVRALREGQVLRVLIRPLD